MKKRYYTPQIDIMEIDRDVVTLSENGENVWVDHEEVVPEF